mmetsp:Transcript_31983/g.48232  ORF Transcript_31983/g.48232 Transcript_31983/m.48232 type:complete len:90 (+) Transcript_31983:520-789(+)
MSILMCILIIPMMVEGEEENKKQFGTNVTNAICHRAPNASAKCFQFNLRSRAKWSLLGRDVDDKFAPIVYGQWEKKGVIVEVPTFRGVR